MTKYRPRDVWVNIGPGGQEQGRYDSQKAALAAADRATVQTVKLKVWPKVSGK